MRLSLGRVSWMVFAGLLLSVPLDAPLSAQERQPPTEAEIDALAEKTMAAFNVPGIAIGVIKDGEVIHAKGYGVRTHGENTPVNAQTLFQIASNTKAMTAAALAILMDDGLLSWNDKVTQHIPEFRMHEGYVSQEFTIMDLLTHRSGLPLGAGDLLFFPNGNGTVEDVINALPHLKPATSFRSEYAYDNLLYVLAGEIVARVSGMPFATFVEDRIFAPLGMVGCVGSHVNVPEGANEATPHALVDGTITAVAFADEAAGTEGAGGVNCNIDGLMKWHRLQLNHGQMENGEWLFSKERHGEMWTPVTITRVTPPSRPGETVDISLYGLGWGIRNYMDHQMISHSGGLLGMVTFNALIPEQNLGIVILTNQFNGSFQAVLSALLSGYLDHAEDMDFEARAARSQQGSDGGVEAMAKLWADRGDVSQPTLSLNEYAMTYTDAWYGNVTIALAGDSLRFISARDPDLTGTLRHFNGNTFVVEWDDRTLRADAYLTFEVTKAGAVDRIAMAKFDPRTDFSFDFWDLDLRPVR